MHGDLYGTSVGGGEVGDGAVFAVSQSSGAERLVHSFSCCATSSDGQYPFSRLTVANGTLYGTTRNGGKSNLGTIFGVTPSGTESVLYSFAGKPDGTQPQASLVLLDGALYGATTSGGSSSEGAIFTLTP